jgi:hypothetical protein
MKWIIYIMTTTMTNITLSKTTLAILKNFSSLNSNILVSPGNTIKTITPSMTGMAEATVEESFPLEFGIWDLNKFLGVISLFQNPNFIFDDKFVRIEGLNGTAVNYFYSSPNLLTTPKKEVKMPKICAETELSQDAFSELSRASSILQLPDICFRSKNDSIYAIVCDLKDPTSNSCEVDLESSANGKDFSFNFKMDNIRLLGGNYKISFAKNVVATFENLDIPLKYWFAMESTSTYNG